VHQINSLNGDYWRTFIKENERYFVKKMTPSASPRYN